MQEYISQLSFMEMGCENWKTLFLETERTRVNDPQRLVQLAAVSNRLLIQQTHRRKELAKKKDQLQAMMKIGNATVKSMQIKQGGTADHPSSVLQQVQDEEVQHTRLGQKMRNLEYAVHQQRLKNSQAEDTLKLYVDEQDQLRTLTTRLYRERTLLDGQKGDMLRQIQNLKYKQEHAVQNLRTTRDETEQQCKQQICTVKSPNIINPSKNSNRQPRQIEPIPHERMATEESTAPFEPCSKLQVKQILRCFYILSKLSNRCSSDIQHTDIIEKGQARILSKYELINYFERKHFPIDERFHRLVCKRYELLKEELKSLEIQYNLQQEQIKEKEERLKQLQEEYRQYRSDREVLEGLKLNEQLLRNLEASSAVYESMIVRFLQFYYTLLGRLFRIVGCIRLIVDGLASSSTTDKKLKELAEEFYNNTTVGKYWEFVNPKQIAKVGSCINGLTTEPEFSAIRRSRLINTFMSEDVTQCGSPSNMAYQLIEGSHSVARGLLNTLTKLFDGVHKSLHRVVYPKKKLLMARVERFRDAYCIESPEFYCRDNMKLIEKIESMKMKNMGSRKILPADSELISDKQPIKDGKDRSPEFGLHRRRNPLIAVKPRLSATKLDQCLSKTISSEFSRQLPLPDLETNRTNRSPHTNMLSQRKRLQQQQNMSVRNILSIVKKIGIMDASRARTTRHRL